MIDVEGVCHKLKLQQQLKEFGRDKNNQIKIKSKTETKSEDDNRHGLFRGLIEQF